MYGEEYLQNSVSSLSTNNRDDGHGNLPVVIGMDHNTDTEQRSKGHHWFVSAIGSVRIKDLQVVILRRPITVGEMTRLKLKTKLITWAFIATVFRRI